MEESYVVQSLEDGDSNALILPGMKGKKRKPVNQELGKVKINKPQKLSKSKRRKLKKIEEENEKNLLLSKSIETLNKYQLPELAYPLLQSTRNINKAETFLEKRRRSVHLSKEGLVHLQNVDSSKEKKEDSQRFDSKVEDHISQQNIQDNCITQPKSVTVDSHSKPACEDETIEPMPNRNMDSSPEPCINDEIQSINSMGQNEADQAPPGINCNQISSLQDLPESTPSAVPTVVCVFRPPEVEEKRKNLPIVMMEQEIMETINYNTTVIICGETGCGKTTQVPQFLYEAGYGSSKSEVQSGVIGVTQPRRVAVLATARRVAYELGLHLGKEVGFQVRYDKRIGNNCSIKFMTDGILLREVQNDFLLRCYSVLILDEAHERSLNTDILIGMLSRVVKIRQAHYDQQQQMIRSGEKVSPELKIFPLKLVLMSATLRVEDFVTERLFFIRPPVIEVPTRQYPVTVHFSKRTDVVDYIGQAYKKVLAIHKRLPPGGVLVFVTGQREVEYLCKKLQKASREFTKRKSVENVQNVVYETNSSDETNTTEIGEAFEIHGNAAYQQTDRFSAYDEDQCNVDEDESDISYCSESESELGDVIDDTDRHSDENGNLEDIFGDRDSLASLKAAFEALSAKKSSNTDSVANESLPLNSGAKFDESKTCSEKRIRKDDAFCPGALYVLPLYAMLPAAAQLRVFEEVKEGERLVVVATNVAETSLTIPGIKYVVDTGREKVKNYNSANGMETYEVQWISKASAAQRTGRAGRTGPGHCYRLYSSAVFSNIFHDFSLAEISKVPVEGVVLLLKSMNIKKVANFPFPTPPENAAMLEAEKCLNALEALNGKGELTHLGKFMAYYPLSPRHSRMLLTVIKSVRHEYKNHRANMVLAYAVAAAAAMSLTSPFVMQLEETDTNRNDSEPCERSNGLESEKVMEKEEKFKKQKLRESLKKFCNFKSDTLTVAYALQCFENSQSRAEFCASHALHLKTMEEMSKLRQQLLKLVFYQNNGGFEDVYSWKHGTLDDVEQAWMLPLQKYSLLPNEEQLICQAICAGWVDRVARRISGITNLSDADKRAHAVRYQACLVEEIVFLHRRSSVSYVAPEFLVYNELLYTNRPYMHGVTSIEPSWLVEYGKSSCSFSSPLIDPRPFYDRKVDQVKYWVIPNFGRFSWELPKYDMPISNLDYRVQVFAYAFLEGQVCPCLKSARKYMAASPGIILKREALGQKRVGNLLGRMKTKLITSSAKLKMVWVENPWELYEEILDWFQQGFRKNLKDIWLHMHKEILES